MSKFGFAQAQLGSTGATAIQADSQPFATFDDNGRPGWKYVKDASSAIDDKFNYYYFSGQYEQLKCKDINTLFMVGSVDKWTGEVNQCPFHVLYTKPKYDGSDAAAWYHSRHAWVLDVSSQLVRAGERCAFYCINEPEASFEGARKVRLNTRVDTGVWDENNEVLFATLHSDSGAGEVECLVEAMGVDCHSFNRHPKSCIYLNCIA